MPRTRIVYRSMLLREKPAVLEIESLQPKNRWDPEDIAPYFKRWEYRSKVMLADGEAIGFALCQHNTELTHIKRISTLGFPFSKVDLYQNFLGHFIDATLIPPDDRGPLAPKGNHLFIMVDVNDFGTLNYLRDSLGFKAVSSKEGYFEEGKEAYIMMFSILPGEWWEDKNLINGLVYYLPNHEKGVLRGMDVPEKDGGERRDPWQR